jgi:hypothetical protein
MNTRTRRFVLRLIVGLLTFLIGVAAAMLLGHFNPLDGNRAQPLQMRSRCGDHARAVPPPPPPPAPVAPLPPTDTPAAPRATYLIYREQLDSGKASQASQPPGESVVPSFEDEGELKTPRPVAPSHKSR